MLFEDFAHRLQLFFVSAPTPDRPRVRRFPYLHRARRGYGLLLLMETMRYRDAADVEKILWKTEAVTWGEQEGRPYLQVGAVTWQDQGQPWAVFTVEELTYNVAVSDYVRDRGL